MMEEKISLKLNDKGLSLVELIVAVSIGAIVAGAVTALMTYAVRSYHNESVNTEMQYELQTNINMMMDDIMGASTFAIVQNPGSGEPRTKYALFGNPYTDIILDDGTASKGFKGVIFVSSAADPGSGKFKVFMKRINLTYAVGAADAKTIAENQMTTYFRDLTADHTEYLLGENCVQFEITPPDPSDVNIFEVEKPDPSDPDTWIYRYM